MRAHPPLDFSRSLEQPTAPARTLPPLARGAAAVLLTVLFAALPLSTATTNVAGALLILLALAFWTRLRARLGQIDPRLLLLLLLVPMSAIAGSVIALANGHAPWKVLASHRKELLFVAVAVLLSVLPPSHEQRLRHALWAGTALAVLLTFAAWLGDYSLAGGPFNPVEPVSMTHAFHNFIVGTVSLWMVISAAEGNDRADWRRLAVGAVGALGLFTVFFVVTGRTGQVGVLVMLLVYLGLRLRRRAAVAAVASLAVVTGVLLAAPTAFGDRIQLIRTEMQAYAGGEQVTSIGLRILYWSTAADLIADRPLLGYGTGSFRAVQDARLGIAPTSEKSAPHPHNDLLHFWIERGLPGLLALLGAYLGHWWAARSLPSPRERALLQAVVAGFFVAGLFNAFYLDWASGSFLFALAALMLAGAGRRPRPT